MLAAVTYTGLTCHMTAAAATLKIPPSQSIWRSCATKKSKNQIEDRTKQQWEKKRHTTSEYGAAAFLVFSSLTPTPLPFTTELANESDSGVTSELLVVFIHGIGTRCTLDT